MKAVHPVHEKRVIGRHAEEQTIVIYQICAAKSSQTHDTVRFFLLLARHYSSLSLEKTEIRYYVVASVWQIA